MVRTLIVIRHAKSSWSLDISDELRPLNPRGYDSLPLMATRNILQEHLPEEIWSSPAVRAYTTAFGLAQEMELELSKIRLFPDFYPGDAAAILAQLRKSEADCVWLIGHNPCLHHLVEFISGATVDHFPTLAVARINMTDNGLKLIELDYPKNRER